MITSYSGKYVNITTDSDDTTVISHEMMNMDAYIHITSPIRRLVDLLNMIQIQENMALIQLSNGAYTFYSDWSLRVEQINKDTKSIKKIQADCNLLYLCDIKPEIMEQIHKGYAYSKKLVKNMTANQTTTADKYEYLIYLPDLNITNRVFSNEEDLLYTPKNYKLYLFNDEEKFKKKIRLQLFM
jgi:exoribonuclease R